MVKRGLCLQLLVVIAVSAFAQQRRNPVLKGYFADPDIIYAEQTRKFNIYPTSDGFTNWSGTYFKAFSSPGLVHWKDEGVILDIGKEVSWAKRNAWAPCIIEKKINGKYRYMELRWATPWGITAKCV
ncbi:family 43 glycosylhydrolase [uncultured Chitinophaga sp.]|jgi:Beta-xylosidase|uniref:family 43 glycosylhydrolase n=1 Tax=uncultured Chitinophaga sp. TaxID=339340 RepID=UPI002619057F|nr:family 43 glycosylhydrolase [uncultured Chitinophaga sp.]